MTCAHSMTSKAGRGLCLAVLCALVCAHSAFSQIHGQIQLAGWSVFGESLTGVWFMITPEMGNPYDEWLNDRNSSVGYLRITAQYPEAGLIVFDNEEGTWVYYSDAVGSVPLGGTSASEYWAPTSGTSGNPYVVPGSIIISGFEPYWGEGVGLQYVSLSWGFGLGLSTWAMVLTVGVGIRWIRELADAAT